MFDNSFMPLVLSAECAGGSFLEQFDVADEITGYCLQAPDWIAAGSTRSPVSPYARHFSPAIGRGE